VLRDLTAKNKTLILTTSSLIIFSLILLATIYINQKHKLENLQNQYYNNLKISYEKLLEKHKNFYEFRLKANIRSKGVQEAFANRDRDKLLDLIQGRWDVLKDENPYLKIMHFHLPNGESFLRVHKKEKFGDNIAQKRAMAESIHKLQKPLFGFEAGIYMLAYRTFLPIFYKEKYIGAVEFGSRPDQILHEMDYFNSIKGALFVKEDKIIEYKEKSDLMIGEYKLQYSTLEDEILLKHLPKNCKLDKDTTIEVDDKHYSIYIFNLGDFENKTSAKAIFFHDISDIKNAFFNTVKQLIILLLGLLGLLIIVINTGFKGIIDTLEKTNKDLDKNKNFISSILENSAHAIITTDSKGTITLFNNKAEELLGYKAKEIINKQTPAIFHKKEEVLQRAKEFSKEFEIDLEPGFEVFVAKTEIGIENNDEWTYITKDKVEIPVSLHITKLIDSENKLTGYLGIAEDIRQKKILENVLKDQRDELETIFNTTKDGIAILDLQTNFLFFNDAYLNMSGFTKDELLQKSCAGLSAPEDLERAKEALGIVLENGFIENFEKTCIVKDGKRLKVNMSISLMPDQKRLLISAKDITEAKEKEKQIKEYIKLVDRNIITSTTDLDGNIKYVSEAFCKISGYRKEELIGKNHRVIKHPDMPNSVYKELWNTIKNNKTWNGEIKNISKDKNFYWVNASISPIFNDLGDKVGYTAIRQDITDKKIIEQISITDGLTNIYNRRHFNDLFPKIINSAKRDNELVSFLIMDIDHFKQYNDTYGHQMGDDVLVRVADCIKNSLHRADDHCFRLGGEEFGIIFKVESKNKAIEFANTIRENIENLHINHIGNSASPYVTASMGLISKNANDINGEDEVYKQSDDLLYEAKESGRNRVVGNF